MCSHLSRLTLLLCIHIALRWSAGIELIAFYRHIAPLERKQFFFFTSQLSIISD